MFLNRLINYFKPSVVIASLEEPVLIEPEELVEILSEEEPENPFLVKTEKIGYQHAFVNISSRGNFSRVNYSGMYKYTETEHLPIRQEVVIDRENEPKVPTLPEI